MTDTNLSHKVALSGSWLFSLRILSRGLGFIRTIILARLLTPADFGLIGMAMAVIATIDSLSQTGFQTALIQKKNFAESHLDTAWTLLILRGLILFGILFMTAPLISQFFNNPDVNILMRVIAISVILAGFRNIGLIFFYKDLQFDKHFKYELFSTVIDLIISIMLAFILRNVWALVWGGLAGNISRLIMSYTLSAYRPNFSIDTNSLKDLFSFGKWIIGSGIIYAALAQIDSLIVGKYLGPAALGIYQMAMLISYLPSSEISTIGSQITLPAYSMMQDDSQRLKTAYLDVLRLTAFIGVPIGAFVFIMAPEFVKIFLGAQWLPVIGCIQILVFSGTVIALSSTASSVFTARGRPKIEMYLQAGNLLFLVTLIYPLTKFYGIEGTAMALVTSNSMIALMSFYTISRLTGTSYAELIKAIIFPIVNGILTACAILLCKIIMPALSIAHFCIYGIFALVIYMVLSLILDMMTGNGIINFLKVKANNLTS
jgi:lipopolysaccharide exporter